MSPATVTHTIAFIVVCGFLLLVPTLATPTPPPAIPLPPLLAQDPHFQRCLTTLQGVHGCLEEIITSFLSLQAQLIGPACCKSFLDIEDKCLPKIFPVDPFFVTLLKNQCSTIVARAKQPPSSPPVTTVRKVMGN